MIMAEQQLSKVLDEKLEENEKTAPLEWTFMYDGVLYTMMTSCLETLKRINTFRAREDDIILILALFQNPKDTAVSYFHFFKGIKLISDHETWDEFLEAFITGKESSLSSEKKIAKFFGFSVTEEKIETIVKETSFESMKDNSGTYGKVGPILFRKGIVGDWTSAFSESQSERMDRKFEGSVAKTKLGMMLKYEVYCKN
ncbi:Sult6b1: Sulfotransferase [Crotalus adamanteus]|uniref:Sulfotransferase n=1 Tax=Crotalus adamanteus TaxID=8729 RepID=A0AAW1CB71_CROAD